MPSLYIVLDKKIPGADTGVDGNSLSKHNKELEKMAKGLGVKPLMGFFSTSKEEVESLVGEDAASLDNIEEKWFAAEEGLLTVNALLGSLKASNLGDVARVEADLREFVSVLELAKANGIRWHLAVDY
ncbi:MAG TPA: hypothetical protein VJN89_16705 [Candidatus Acidoferrum sp.]|nr:hypothetical protein [Candidatus Acidoferrum sp.]